MQYTHTHTHGKKLNVFSYTNYQINIINNFPNCFQCSVSNITPQFVRTMYFFFWDHDNLNCTKLNVLSTFQSLTKKKTQVQQHPRGIKKQQQRSKRDPSELHNHRKNFQIKKTDKRVFPVPF